MFSFASFSPEKQLNRDTKLFAILRRQYGIVLTALKENIFRIGLRRLTPPNSEYKGRLHVKRGGTAPVETNTGSNKIWPFTRTSFVRERIEEWHGPQFTHPRSQGYPVFLNVTSRSPGNGQKK